MKKISLIFIFFGILAAQNVFAQTIAVGQYTTKEDSTKAFLAAMRTIPASTFTVKSSDKNQGTIQAIRMDKSGTREFASLFVLIMANSDESSLIEATFTRNSGYFGGGKPTEWAKTFGEDLKVILPDVIINVVEQKKR